MRKNPNDRPAPREIETAQNRGCAPESDRREPGILVAGEETEMRLRPACCQLESTRLVAHQLQIGACFGLIRVEGECALVVEDGAAEIAAPEVSVAQIVEQGWIPVSTLDERLVT